MKIILPIFLVMVMFFSTACSATEDKVGEATPTTTGEDKEPNLTIAEESSNTNQDQVEKKMKINIIVQNQTFVATLEDNETAKTFASLLPMTLEMEDVNNNEKYYDLSETIRQEPAKNPGSIQIGDIKCYGDAGIVLFYDSFPTSYSYVSIGHIEDSDGLADVLGEGNVEVTFTNQ